MNAPFTPSACFPANLIARTQRSDAFIGKRFRRQLTTHVDTLPGNTSNGIQEWHTMKPK